MSGGGVKSSKRNSLVIWDESTETIANGENFTEQVHIEIAEDDKLLQQRTVPFEKVPIWMQDNALITDAYRPPLFSYKSCLKSLFYQHNESGRRMIGLVHSMYFNNVYLVLKIRLFSVNIWSHFLGLILFVVIGLFSWFVFLAPLRPILGPGDIAVFYVFILGAMVCLGMSSSFHCFIAHSEKVRILTNQGSTGSFFQFGRWRGSNSNCGPFSIGGGVGHHPTIVRSLNITAFPLQSGLHGLG